MLASPALGERMTDDRFGLPLETASPAAAFAYVDGVDLLLAAEIGGEARLDAAIAADARFALAWAARARQRQIYGRMADARADVAQARTLAAGAGVRTAGHVECVALAIEGAPGAYARILAHLDAFPRDAVPLSLALGAYGLIAFSGRRDHDAVRRDLCERLAPRWGAEWWFDGFRGWARIEAGDVAGGMALVDRSLDARPRNANAAHARAHGLHEAGAPERADTFLASWLAGYDRDGVLHGHLSWHRALCALAAGDVARAQAIYADAITPERNRGAPLQIVADAASLLWRCEIAGARLPSASWTNVGACAERGFPRAGLAFGPARAARRGGGGRRGGGRAAAGRTRRDGRVRSPPVGRRREPGRARHRRVRAARSRRGGAAAGCDA